MHSYALRGRGGRLKKKKAAGTKTTMKLIYPSILSSFIHIEHSHNANAEAIAYQTSHHKTRSPIKFSQEIKTFSSFVRTSILPFALKFCEITQLYQAARGQIRRDNTVEHFPSPAKFFGFGVFLFCFWLFVGFLVLGFCFFFLIGFQFDLYASEKRLSI